MFHTVTQRAPKRDFATMLSESNRAMYETTQVDTYCDLTLRLGDSTELRCHRVVVCTQCEFFANSVKPGRFNEASGIINLKSDPPHAIRSMIEFLYTKSYSASKQIEELDPEIDTEEMDLEESDEEDMDDLEEYGPEDIDLVEIELEASDSEEIEDELDEMFGSAELGGKRAGKKSNLERFGYTNMLPEEYAEAVMGHAEVYVVADFFRIPDLKERAARFLRFFLKNEGTLDVFPRLVNTIYSGVPDSQCSLRDDLFNFAAEHVAELSSGGRLRSMMEDLPDFMEKLTAAALSQVKQTHSQNRLNEDRLRTLGAAKRRYRCPECGGNFDGFSIATPDVKLKIRCPDCSSRWFARPKRSNRS
ncbi:btb poz domain protein [Diplodia corticola]|uniref:Btb poz domain protein n=1 Tax=Diplodia corticola TaxID=236234 RepID=A0A1J9RXV2_9PEZI|nr:btb poz domain protein [Diplodia corticola]OJD32301.1 btb poz domain protein [Diplodia corticola]